MKQAALLYLKALLRHIGSILGSLLRLLPRTIRQRTVTSMARFSLRVPARLSFLMYELTSSALNGALADYSDMYLERELSEKVKLRLDICKTTQRQIYLSRVYEPHVTEYVRTHLKHGDLFIDVGANVGYYTVIASKLVGESGRVIAFEPESRNFSDLRRNIVLNNATNVVCLQRAVGSVSGVAELRINPLNEGGHSIIESRDSLGSTGKSEELRTERVEVTTIDKVLGGSVSHHGTILIKIDVEGFELDVLQGMSTLLSSKIRPIVICEVSARKEAIFSYLDKHGYNVRSLHGTHERVSITSDSRKRDYLFMPA